jgi:hypothetical protein
VKVVDLLADHALSLPCVGAHRLHREGSLVA